MLTEQVALVVVGVPRLHVTPRMLTVPVGAVAPVPVVSVTVTVQLVNSLIAKVEGVHTTVVLVVCAAGCEMLTVVLPVLAAWIVSPA